MSGNYIVVFKDNVTQAQIDKYVQEVNEKGGEVTHQYHREGGILNGFAAKITEQQLMSFTNLQGDIIDYIEPDSVVTTQ